MSPIANGKTETFGNFDLVKRVQLDYTDVAVSKWRSRVTGLSIVHLDFEGEHNQRYTMAIQTHFKSSSACQWLLRSWYRKYAYLLAWVAIY